MADEIETNIAANEAALDAGVSSSATDNVSTSFDLDHIARRNRTLKRRYWAARGHRKHPTVSQPYRFTGGCE